MTDLDRDKLREIWLQLSRRNDWKLVEDEMAFLEEAEVEWRRLNAPDASGGSLRLAIMRTYSALQYRHFCQRNNQAAEELRTAAFRLALYRGWAFHEADELAQETVTRMFAQRRTLETPEALCFWMSRILQTAQRDYLQQRAHETAIPTTPEGVQIDFPDHADMAESIELFVLSDTIMENLRAIVPNVQERTVLLRVIFWNERPRHIARNLGWTLPYTRALKCRALRRLKEDPRSLGIVRELLGDVDLTVSTTGVDSDEAQTSQ